MSARTEQFRDLLTRYPDDPLVWFSYGTELSKENRWAEAVDAFAKATALKPSYTTAYREWGKALAALGRIDQARGRFADGIRVAEETGDLQVKKEIEIFLRRLP